MGSLAKFSNWTYLRLNTDRLNAYAQDLAGREIELPHWNNGGPLQFWPAKPQSLNEADALLEYYFIGNIINFCFWGFQPDGSLKKNILTYPANAPFPLDGAFAMWACWTRLKNRLESLGLAIDGHFLAQLSLDQAEVIFAGNPDSIRMPLLEQRLDLLKRTGDALVKNYDGRFINLVRAARFAIFDRGHESGILTRLQQLPGYQGDLFAKRAQLAVAMAWERLREYEAEFPVFVLDPGEFGSLSIFADYHLPRALILKGVLEFRSGDNPLREAMWHKCLIVPGSDQELELRAATVIAASLAQWQANEIRAAQGLQAINAMHLDIDLFNVSRAMKKEDPHHHLTLTTDY